MAKQQQNYERQPVPCYTPSQASAIFLTVFVITVTTKGQDTIVTETTKDTLKKSTRKKSPFRRLCR